MWATIFAYLAIIAYCTLGAPVPPCPKTCTCVPFLKNNVEAHCGSLDFLKKPLTKEQQIAIVSVVVNGTSSLESVPNLNILSHLKYLDLSANKLRRFRVDHLPKSIEYLDFSYNSIKEIPKDFDLLPRLKTISFVGNPINCDCASFSLRDKLIKNGVKFYKPLECSSPSEYSGKSFFLASCKDEGVEHLVDGMQGDAPYEGSGSGDGDGDGGVVITDDEFNGQNRHFDSSIEDEFIVASDKKELSTSTSTSPSPNLMVFDSSEVEGSGDEMETSVNITEIIPETTTFVNVTDVTEEDYEEEYDWENATEVETPFEETEIPPLLVNHIPACNFNCSTPSPIEGVNDTSDLLPPPGVFEGMEILANDLNIIRELQTTTLTMTTVTAEATSLAEQSPENLTTTEITSPEVDILVDNINVKEESENVLEDQRKQSNSTFIFLAVLLLVIVSLIIYAIVKKRSMKRNVQLEAPPSEGKEILPEEIELLKKSVQDTGRLNGAPHESVPLMNGHNENKDVQEEENPDTKKQVENYPETNDIDLRQKTVEPNNCSPPETKRVTVKATEIPNATPKTPILVTRHVNSDGSIVTTPTIDQLM